MLSVSFVIDEKFIENLLKFFNFVLTPLFDLVRLLWQQFLLLIAGLLFIYCALPAVWLFDRFENILWLDILDHSLLICHVGGLLKRFSQLSQCFYGLGDPPREEKHNDRNHDEEKQGTENYNDDEVVLVLTSSGRKLDLESGDRVYILQENYQINIFSLIESVGTSTVIIIAGNSESFGPINFGNIVHCKIIYQVLRELGHRVGVCMNWRC